MTNLDSILKSRDYFAKKVCLVKAMVFPVWRRLLRVPWTARRFNQSILKEINPKYSLEGLMLKLKLQFFGANLLEKTMMLRKIEDRRRRGLERMRWLNSITDSMDMNLRKLLEIAEDRGAWPIAVHGITKSQTQFSD